MSDYISRDATEEIFAYGKEDWKDYEAAACIAALPAADVAPVRRGQWLSDEESKIAFAEVCSVCGNPVWWDNGPHKYLYCPNCGARMEVTE